jgi:predicted nucleic acid-binding Zn ribbon protein
MVNSYILVNPHIEGAFDRKIKADNSREASNTFYKNLSEHFNNSVPSFHFTIQKGSSGDGKLYHFEVKETMKNKEVTFSINPMTIQNEDESVKRFKKNLSNFKAKFKQDGGKKKKHRKKDDSSSSSSSSDSDYLIKAKKSYSTSQPIYYWWYDPYLYNLDYLFVPTFYSYITPYVQLDTTSTAYWPSGPTTVKVGP